VSLLLCVRLAASSGVVVVVSMCRVSSGTDLIVPFVVFEKDGEGGGLFWMLGFPPPFRVFMAYEETGVSVLAGALIVSIFGSMPTAGS
jgi:hypothetical protein